MGIKEFLVIIILIIASIQDIKYREVSNLASLFISIISIIDFKIINLLGLTIAPLPMILTNLKIKNNFGGADIKIMASIGLCFGTTKALLVLLVALLIETIIKKIKYVESQPLVPYILIGFIIINFVWKEEYGNYY